MIKEAISKLSIGKDLEKSEASEVMDEIMGGETSQAQTAAFLTALHIKGETVEEIYACAEGMRKYATKVERDDMDVLEIVGTGGDKANTFNISTAAAFVVSAAGVRVAKHGNRAASSKCGTADCPHPQSHCVLPGHKAVPYGAPPLPEIPETDPDTRFLPESH